ncbi:capping protein inhibiting regulator of actin dynamics isoform X1 [Scophthalmus maximus]|uniref:capping protein inhibiting regulator of actin dynamics isoform X1 n=2 Tax=Scophthalmus maximus TaxID=52904 RepID=UPI001FA82185|nr:capping protein inhibiting regulator of actin dynamics isoform X1 [Scophthalmus maximus]
MFTSFFSSPQPRCAVIMATDAVETKHDMLLEVTESKGPERRRQGKFQPFRRLFGRKKKERQAKGGSDGAEPKGSVSPGEVCNGVVSDDEESNPNLSRELNPIGSRALSHDSIFIPEEPVTGPGLDHSMSQENVSDKVRNLQRQIAQGIKFGQRPPSLRRSEGDEASSDEEELPRSPLKVLAQVEAEPPNTEAKQVQGTHTHSTPVKSPRSKRVLPPTGTIESINLDSVPQSAPRLDNTAAKHKLSVKPKNQRISRKHRRFTQDLQDVSIPGVVREDLEAAGVSGDDQRRASVDSLDSFKKQRLHEEERQETRRKREREEQWLRQEEDERRKRAEEMRLREQKEENEKCLKRQEEERRQREEAERKRMEEEEKRLQEEAERKRRGEEEERRIREEEDRRRLEEEERMQREEQERRMREEEERRQQEEEEERRRLEEQRRKEELERRRREEKEEAETRRKLKEEEEERKKEEEVEKLRLQEMEEKKRMEAEERMRKEEEQRRIFEEADGSSDAQERKRRAEEVRWREMEERQRPFSFKVSSGEKQILFQKVNLTPVTPTSGLQSGAAAEHGEGGRASSSEGPDSPNLPASPYVPHTAILVTGAQLCGTAVNLDQITDTACKSLLGLGEDRKAQGTPPTKGKTSPDRKSGKTKSLNESALSPDQSGAAVLAEWASIRSKIFKGVEDGKYEDHPDQNRNQPQPSSEDQPEFSHTNLRKTMSASAKFSITPAKKKFGDSNRNSEVFGADATEAEEEAAPSDSPTAAASPAPTGKPQSRASKTVRIVERGSEECMFAKDLPSFLVPSPGAKSDGAELRSGGQSATEASESREVGGEQGPDGEDKPSPFGIKLRRTNFSLRFHSEQSTEKRKKRYSAGDSFDGVPSPLTPMDPDFDASSVFSDKSSPASPQTEGAVGKYLHASASPAGPRAKPAKSTSPTTRGEGEKVLSKPPLYRRPTTSPRTSGSVPTPPPSPLPKVAHGPPSDAVIQRTGGVDSSGKEQTRRSEEPSVVAHLHQSGQGPVQVEEEPKEKRSFFPSINIPWREKVDRKAELIRKEKPSLQSRHSLDSARVQEKEAGPLWVTLALQKQKGFREQQQTREEHRSQREAKLAEKHSRDRDSVTLLSPTECRGSGSCSPPKPQTPEAPKRPDSLLGRLERKEHLKKANTLPSSVTVEIADSTPSPPAVKEVSKRFPSSDSPQVSTEPAWLALAKRKAKAWSDCPQIIK